MGNASWWFPVVDQALWTSYAPLNYVHQGVLSTPGCDRWQSAFGPKAKEGRDLFLWPYAQRENKLSISPSAAVAKQRKMKRGRCSLLSEKYKELKYKDEAANPTWDYGLGLHTSTFCIPFQRKYGGGAQFSHHPNTALKIMRLLRGLCEGFMFEEAL